MRIADGFVNPIVGLIGWILAFSMLFFIAKNKADISNQELSTLAGLGAFLFLIQALTIPFVPVYIALSGIPLAITISGTTRGILIGTAAMILNHIFIPGSIFMLGTNLTNMMITSILLGWFPSSIYHNPFSGRRVRYLTTFLAGFIYVIIEATIITVELVLFYRSDESDPTILIGVFSIVILLALVEGFFTAIASSYYHRAVLQKYQTTIGLPIITDSIPETEIEKIDFDLQFIEELKEMSS